MRDTLNGRRCGTIAKLTTVLSMSLAACAATDPRGVAAKQLNCPVSDVRFEKRGETASREPVNERERRIYLMAGCGSTVELECEEFTSLDPLNVKGHRETSPINCKPRRTTPW